LLVDNKESEKVLNEALLTSLMRHACKFSSQMMEGNETFKIKDIMTETFRIFLCCPCKKCLDLQTWRNVVSCLAKIIMNGESKRINVLIHRGQSWDSK
jgi:hypothetical protein